MTRARLFGVDVDAQPALAGVPDEPIGARPLLVRPVRRDVLMASFRGLTPAEVGRDQHGRALVRLWRDDARGTLMAARGYGAFAIDATASTVGCAPVRSAAWRWQRYLIGKVLPLVAALRGLEVLHASAVTHGDVAIAIAGASHAGKSTLAATWLRRGARLVADDVIALEREGTAVRVHPGPGVLSLRDGTARLVGPAETFGTPLGHDGFGARVAVERHGSALGLGALVLLERSARDTIAITVEPRPDPRILLGSAFSLTLRTPARLERLLDMTHAIAASVPVISARVPVHARPDDVVDAIEAALR